MNAGGSADVDEVPQAGREEPVRWARWADRGLWAVACSGFALSYSSVQKAAVAHVDHVELSYLVPLVGDGAALAAAARYVADRRAGIGGRGWQLLAWATIAASAALNAMDRTAGDAVWHLVGPGALAAITELYARRAARLRRQELDEGQDRIPVRLWLTSPVASVRLWLWMARTGQRSMLAARRAMGRHAAARQALRAACRGRAYWRMRQIARAQLRADTLAPAAVLDVLGWTGDRPAPADPRAVLQALLAAALNEAHQGEAHRAGREAHEAHQGEALQMRLVPGGVPGEQGDADSDVRVVTVLRDAHEPLTPMRLAEVTGLSRATVTRVLARLRTVGEVTPTGRGRYTAAPSLVDVLDGEGA